MTKKLLVLGALAALSLPAAAEAQGRGRNSDGVPPGQRPPAGMCRIWIDGVPPGRQPAPTSCAEAVRTRPSNARVIWGDDSRYSSNGNGKYKNKGRKGGYDRDEDREDDDRYDRDRRDGRDGRYDRNGSYDRSGRYPSGSNSSDYCADRDHDGICDYRQTNGRTTQTPSGGTWSDILRSRRTTTGSVSTCVDVNRNGVCDDRERATSQRRAPGTLGPWDKGQP